MSAGTFHSRPQTKYLHKREHRPLQSNLENTHQTFQTSACWLYNKFSLVRVDTVPVLIPFLSYQRPTAHNGIPLQQNDVEEARCGGHNTKK